MPNHQQPIIPALVIFKLAAVSNQRPCIVTNTIASSPSTTITRNPNPQIKYKPKQMAKGKSPKESQALEPMTEKWATKAAGAKKREPQKMMVSTRSKRNAPNVTPAKPATRTSKRLVSIAKKAKDDTADSDREKTPIIVTFDDETASKEVEKVVEAALQLPVPKKGRRQQSPKSEPRSQRQYRGHHQRTTIMVLTPPTIVDPPIAKGK